MDPNRRRLPRILTVAALVALAVGLFLWLALQQQRLSERQELLNATLVAQQAQLTNLATDLADRQDAAAAGITPSPPPAEDRSPARAELPEEQESEAFALGVLQIALDAIARRDAARQRALIGYLAALPESAFRSQMLGMLRDEADDPLAAKAAAAAIAAPDEEADPLPAGAAERLRFGLVEPGRPEGWDYDLLVCPHTLEGRDPYLEGEVDRLLDSLRKNDRGHGRIRLLPLGGALADRDPELGEPGLHLLVDRDRPEELRHGAQLARRLTFDGYDFRVRPALGTPTPWQITLSYCPA
ncbi:MAG: hypothetical protein WD341_13360 [Tistlia sp.]|uniref:hypothetical protein n=1 Tax=Tistlia sp. TaxID=3057121 RepID=UPI0034A2461F